MDLPTPALYTLKTPFGIRNCQRGSWFIRCLGYVIDFQTKLAGLILRNPTLQIRMTLLYEVASFLPQAGECTLTYIGETFAQVRDRLAGRIVAN